jgi:hypothetical protein
LPLAAGQVTTAYGQSVGQPAKPFKVSGRSPLSQTPLPHSDAVTALVTAWIAAPVVAVDALTSCDCNKDNGALLEPPYGFKITVAVKSDANILEARGDSRRPPVCTLTLTVPGSRRSASPIRTDSSLLSSGMFTEPELLFICTCAVCTPEASMPSHTSKLSKRPLAQHRPDASTTPLVQQDPTASTIAPWGPSH